MYSSNMFSCNFINGMLTNIKKRQKKKTYDSSKGGKYIIVCHKLLAKTIKKKGYIVRHWNSKNNKRVKGRYLSSSKAFA